MDTKWWKEAVVYQIYPRSFYDSNGDGIGDLRGIIKKVGYLSELGINAVWLNPVYRSPNDDMGYDISDYYNIMGDFGTLEDFDALVKALHARGIRLIMDLVLNHTSDEHAWFSESRSSRDNPKRDFYIWRDGKDGREPNNWASFFTPSAWKYDEQTGQYYLHLFSEKQPDLNWKNQTVRDELYRMMNWWVERGVDGFRLDVINLIEKAQGLPDSDREPTMSGYCFDEGMFANLPGVHDYLREMNSRVFAGKDIVAIGETPFIDTQTALRYVKEDGRELNMIFAFELMDIDSGASGKWEIIDYDLSKFKRIINSWQLGLSGGWNSLFWSNHDQPRPVSRFGDPGEYRVRSAKMLATVMHMLKGTPYIYQGEEIGMTNMPFEGIEDISDIESIIFYRECLKAGLTESQAFEPILKKGRDNARTPMQWDDSPDAGFTKGNPWQKVNPNYPDINVAKAISDSNSVFHYYRKLIALRKKNDVMVYGDYIPLLADDPNVVAYLRQHNGITWLVAANFFGKDTACTLPSEWKVDSVVLSNVDNAPSIENGVLALAPYETHVMAVSRA